MVRRSLFYFMDFSGGRVPMPALTSVSLQILAFSAVHHTGASELNVFFQGGQFVKVSTIIGSLYAESLIHAAFKKSEEIDDGTLSPEVPSSISPRPPGRLE